MSEKEWVEYFKVINGRSPSPEEYTQFLKSERKKRLQQKLIIGIPAVGFLFVLVFFVRSLYQSQPEIVPEKSPSTITSIAKSTSKDEEVKKVTGTLDDYRLVIENYRIALGDKTKSNLEFVNPEATHTSQHPEVYYSLYDFNGDGKNELILAGSEGDRELDDNASTSERMESYWDRVVYGVYTLDDGEIINNFPVIGYRIQLFPMTNGSFWERGSSSAYAGAYIHYEFDSRGARIEPVLRISYDYEESRSNPKIEDDAEEPKSYTIYGLKNELNQYKILDVHQLEWTRI